MRILHVITGLGNGGAEGTLFRVTGDAENEHHVISLTTRGAYGDRMATAGTAVHTLEMSRGKVTLRGVLSLRRKLRRINPDVVQTWMYHADLLGGAVARTAGKKAVVWGLRASTLNRECTPVTTRIAARLCASLSRSIPRRIVSCSQVAAKQHIDLGYAAERLVIVPNGYDLNALAPDRAARERVRGELGVEDGVVLLGMVARWDAQKDHATLLAALARVAASGSERWRLLLAGPDMTVANAALGHMVDANGLRAKVLFAGQRDDVPALMNALDVHVLSSAFGEAFPNVVAEAMACGTPCVATDVGDAGLIIGNTGWIVPHSHPAALAGAIAAALAEMTEPERWAARKVACRERVVKNYGLEQMITSYRQVWREALDG